MKFFLNAFIFSSISFISLSGFAATVSAGYWTSPAKIISIGIYGVSGSSSFRVQTDTTDVTSANCASANGAYWWWASDTASKETYAMLLAAYSAGKKVSVTFTDECNNSAKRLQHIIISDN